jgi:hypothetical protein
MIPEFTEEGFLPPGHHNAGWEEFIDRYVTNDRRRALAQSLQQFLNLLGFANCSEVRIGGSYVTSKVTPGDFDGVWMVAGADRDKVPMELDYSIAAQPEIFGGCIVPDEHQYTDIGMMVAAIETNKKNEPVGIVCLDPRQVPLAEPWERYKRFFAAA